MHEPPHQSTTGIQSQKAIKARWRKAVNQFSKIQEESRLTLLTTKARNSNKILLRTKNQLAQIDPIFKAQIRQQCGQNKQDKQKEINNISTRHNTNILSSQGFLTNCNLQNTLICYSQTNENQRNISVIREELMEELTELNSSSYHQEMKAQCTRYHANSCSFWPDWFTTPKKPLYQFCYFCDSVMGRQAKEKQHQCSLPLTSLTNVQTALERIQKQVRNKNNKIFSVFLYNTMQAGVQVDQLINNVRVLKQALELKYEPQQAVLRLRLLNLMGKKIGLLLQEQQLAQMLKSLSSSK